VDKRQHRGFKSSIAAVERPSLRKEGGGDEKGYRRSRAVNRGREAGRKGGVTYTLNDHLLSKFWGPRLQKGT